ncbi:MULTISPECIES: DNA methyltransferase [Kamptonema]|uniref:DNA methyltransferase n=1 Tax=Kamptonema TaxID=1501433 RepID=UPI0001DAC585|nr:MULTISPECIES: DNA methyltransferase [Kamptonema]CBN56725.1 conserved hypothetical protein [Kamptonema sp. PCC 6506]
MKHLGLPLEVISKEKLSTNLTANRHPIHRWFNFIAGFSPEFVSNCIQEANLKSNEIIIDPFAGLSTTLVQANREGIQSIGFEVHPFFYDISLAKLFPPKGEQQINNIESICQSVRPYFGELTEIWSKDALAFLNKLVPEKELRFLASALLLENEVNITERHIYRLVLSRVLELASGSQTDGIYKAPTTRKKSVCYNESITKICAEIRGDVAIIGDRYLSKSSLHLMTSEYMLPVDKESCSLCITSPPYLNNFDFAEMTRMELYFWRYASSWREITEKVRRKFIVNTTTVPTDLKRNQNKFVESLSPTFLAYLQPVVSELNQQKRVRPGKKDYDLLVYPYFAQIQSVFREIRRVLKIGSSFHLVVADAALYGVHIQTEKLLAELMQENGFQIVGIENLRTRGERWILKKRDGAKTSLGEFHIHAVRTDREQTSLLGSYIMQENLDLELEESTDEESVEQKLKTDTLYGLAKEAMEHYVRVYIELSRQSHALANIKPEHVQSLEQKIIVLTGINSSLDAASATVEQVVQEWQRVLAIPFDVEAALTKGVYEQMRERVRDLLSELEQETQGFTVFEASYIKASPYMLPLLQRLAKISSKSALKKRIGSVSDNAISEKASQKLADILNQQVSLQPVNCSELIQSIEPTLEGIVRDLVGRILLESVVASALDDAKLSYKRESEYSHIEGVLYNIRADFVIPDDKYPKAFIEVRKSSPRHASLYAKDKMFSAINWKGKHKEMLAVLVIDGPWTSETLKVMAKVFDYVVPLARVADIAQAISAYIQGDKSKLKWLIDFAVKPAVVANTETTSPDEAD